MGMSNLFKQNDKAKGFSIIARDTGEVLLWCENFKDLLRHLRQLSVEVSMAEFFSVCDIVAGDDL